MINLTLGKSYETYFIPLPVLFHCPPSLITLSFHSCLASNFIAYPALFHSCLAFNFIAYPPYLIDISFLPGFLFHCLPSLISLPFHKYFIVSLAIWLPGHISFPFHWLPGYISFPFHWLPGYISFSLYWLPSHISFPFHWLPDYISFSFHWLPSHISFPFHWLPGHISFPFHWLPSHVSLAFHWLPGHISFLSCQGPSNGSSRGWSHDQFPKIVKIQKL